jgi:hypothetical protein
MDENHQDKTESKLSTTKDKIWLPPLSVNKEQKDLKYLQRRLHKKLFAEKMGFTGKKPWDFIQLLLIPLVLAGVGYWFTATQTQVSLQVTEDQQRETTLKTYLDDISDLLLNHNLHRSKPEDEVRQVARERTLTTLRRLDAERNRFVLQFLQDAQLIGVKDAVIDLSYANLGNDYLTSANLRNTNLYRAYLFNADLFNAHLDGANLKWADLRNADLRDAHLDGANLSIADLSNAQNLTQEQLDQVRTCKGAILLKGLTCHHNQ